MSVTLTNLTLDRPLAFLDLESTGVDPAADRVVEVAVLTLLPRGEPESFHRWVNPGAPPFGAIAPELFATLHGCDLAGFGIASFDLPLLATEFARVRIPFRVAGRRVIDVLALYRRLQPRTLASAVREYLSREHEGAHSAAIDARAAAEVLDRQVGRHGLPATPAELHAALVEVDVAGRFRRDDGGHVVFGFGKHVGKALSEVAACDRGYLEWMLTRPFLDDARDLVRRALASR